MRLAIVGLVQAVRVKEAPDRARMWVVQGLVPMELQRYVRQSAEHLHDRQVSGIGAEELVGSGWTGLGTEPAATPPTRRRAWAARWHSLRVVDADDAVACMISGVSTPSTINPSCKPRASDIMAETKSSPLARLPSPARTPGPA